MFTRRIPFFKARPSQGRAPRRNTLVRLVVVVLLLTSLVPLLIIGILNFYRSRSIVTDQVSVQLENIIRNGESPIRQMIDSREHIVDQLVNDPGFHNNIVNLAAAKSGTDEYNKIFSAAFLQMKIYFDYRSYQLTSATGSSEEIIVLRPDGQMLIETTYQSTITNFGSTRVEDAFIKIMMGKSASYMTYNATPISPNNLVFFITRPIKDQQGQNVAQLILYGTNPTFSKALKDTNAFFPNSHAFFYTYSGDLYMWAEPEVKTGTAPDRILSQPAQSGLADTLSATAKSEERSKFFMARDNANTPVVVYSNWMPEYGMGMGIEVPEATVYAQNTLLDPFNVAILVLVMVLSGTLIYIGTRRLVSPLVTLATTADNFSKGQWSERVHIRRNDEIGLLATSFNRMADELSEMYQSLEKVAEKRTGQIRIASEVAQMAASTANPEEMLSRTVELITERFGYYHVALYMIDESGRSLVLTEASGVSSADIKQRGDRVEMIPNSLIGWVALNNKSRVISNVNQDELYRPNPLLPDTLSQVALPVAISNEVMGVLDIQSTLAEAFDNEMVSVLQTLSNQISSTLHNIRLLETTQVSYKETSLLYRATRLVTQAKDEDEITQILTDTFIQLPYVTLILDVQEDQFKVRVVTDSKTGRIERNLVNITIPLRDMGRLLKETPVNLIDIGKPSEFDNILSFLFRRGCKAAALLSVLENGELTKLLAFGSRELEMISHTSVQPYANLAEVIGASLEKFHVMVSLEQRLKDLQALNNFSRAISVETGMAGLYQAMKEQVINTLGSDVSFAVALYNASKNTVEIAYRFEEEKEEPPLAPFPLGEGPTSRVIITRAPLMLLKDTERQMKAMGAVLAGAAAKSWMGVPLLFANQCVGAMVVQDTRQEERFSQSDLSLFTTLAPQVATAIRNAQLLLETQDALKAYQAEHFLLNSLLENSPDAIYFKNTEGKYIRASKSTAEIHRLPVEEISGKTDYELLNDPELADFLWGKQKMMLDSHTAGTEVYKQLNRYTGEESWWQLSGVPVFEHIDDEKPYGLLVVQRDISDMKNAESLARRRADQVTTAAEIARDTTGTLDVSDLLEKSVNLVRERFGFYHASIFLIDALGEYAVLRESTGKAGEQMMQSGHRLAVGSKSIVGTVIAQKQPLIVNDVTKDPNYYPNPLLPDTRGELAIPLMVGERILGAIDVQSEKVNAFNDEDISVLQILADQLAIAISNAELFAKTQELLGKHRLLRQITVAASASTTLEEALLNVVKGLRTAAVSERIEIMMLNEEGVLQTQASAGYEGTSHLEMRIPIGQGITGQAAAEKRPIRVDNTTVQANYISLDSNVRSELAIPILFSEELLGVLNLESTQISAFDENDLEILGALGNNLGGVIANIRLVQQVRRQVERERLLFEVTSKIRRSVDINTILETSTREIARALGAKRAHIQITAGGSPAQPEPDLERQEPGEDMPGSSPKKNGAQKNGGGNGHGNPGQDAQEGDK